jgi:hypothetical protein
MRPLLMSIGEAARELRLLHGSAVAAASVAGVHRLATRERARQPFGSAISRRREGVTSVGATSPMQLAWLAAHWRGSHELPAQ